MAMALRALAGKLRPPSARAAASRAFSQKCEHCGKTSSKIADSLGQKTGALKHDFSEEIKQIKRKHYMIIALTAFASFSILGISGKYTLDLLESDEPLQPILRRKRK